MVMGDIYTPVCGIGVCSGTISIVWPPCACVCTPSSLRVSIWGSLGDDNIRTVTAGQAATHILSRQLAGSSRVCVVA